MSKNIRVIFELTMPHAASWNNKWSGSESGHYIFKEYPPVAFEKKWKDKVIGEWYYRWDDGWEAKIKSRVISVEESRKLKRANSGFCGYNWMVDSILAAGRIMNSKELRDFLNDKQTKTS